MGCWGRTDTLAGCGLAVAADMGLGSRAGLEEGAAHSSRCDPVGWRCRRRRTGRLTGRAEGSISWSDNMGQAGKAHLEAAVLRWAKGICTVWWSVPLRRIAVLRRWWWITLLRIPLRLAVVGLRRITGRVLRRILIVLIGHPGSRKIQMELSRCWNQEREACERFLYLCFLEGY